MQSQIKNIFKELLNFQKPIAALSLFMILASTFGPGLINLSKDTFAAYMIDDNNGYFQVDFNASPQGIAPTGPMTSNTVVDTIAGSIALTPLATTGFFTTIEIKPNSFSGWRDIMLDGNYSALADVRARVLDCSTSPTPLTGVYGSYQTLVGGKLDISGLSATANPCIRVQVELNKTTSITPVINDMKVSWTPLPVLLTQHTVSATNSLVGAIINYSIKYSISYARDNGVTIWAPLPDNTNNPGSIIYPSTYPATSSATSTVSLYGQDATPYFVSADNGGLYTATAITVNGIAIPANSVYWNIGTANAGVTGNLSFKIKSDNGLQNGIQYLTQTHIDGAKSLEKISDSNKSITGAQKTLITLISSPIPKIDKHTKIENAYKIGGVWSTISGGAVVKYNISYGNVLDGLTPNTIPVEGVEKMFTPIITDDITDILAKLTSASCGSLSTGDALGRIVNISNSGSLGSSNIVWASPDLSPASTSQESFSVDYTGCTDGTVINNVAKIKSDNSTQVTDTAALKIGIDLTPKGFFAKGEGYAGVSCIRAGVDDGGTSCGATSDTQLHTWGDDGEYHIIANNSGASRLDDILIFDKVPTGQTFLSAGAADSSVKVYYNTNGILNTTDTPPTYTQATAATSLGGTWTDIVPTTATDVIWVAYYIPSLASPFFPTPAGSVNASLSSSVVVDFNTNITASSTADACTVTDQSNTAVFEINKVSSAVTNADADMLPAVINKTLDTEVTHVSKKKLAKLKITSSASSSEVMAPAQNTITFKVSNTGNDASYSTVINVPIPTTMINGVIKTIDFVSANGGVVTQIGSPVTNIEINVGTLAPTQTKEITVTFLVPEGVDNNTVIRGDVKVSGQDDDNCEPLNGVTSYNFKTLSLAKVEIYKSRDESVIPSKGDIHYQLNYNNLGSAPAHNLYIIDKIPNKTVFKAAYTGGLDENGNSFNCGGCKAYFSQSMPSLPAGVTPLEIFDLSYITSSFTAGTEVSPGKWISPFGSNTIWVAYLADNTVLANPNFSTTRFGSVGLTVTNDNDGTGPSVDGSIDGDVMTNESAIFADEVLQAISNQVITTILPDAGLFIDKKSNVDIIAAGETFDWIIDYRNDSGNSTEMATITDMLPAGVSLLSIYNTWSDYTLTSPTSTRSGGEVNITGSSCVTQNTNPDGTQNIVVAISGCLRGSNLFKNEGGRLRLSVAATNTLLTGAVLLNKTKAQYANASTGPFLIEDEDPVFVYNPDLWIRKQVNITDPVAGDNVDYTLTVSNEGKHFSVNTVVNDELPAGLCYIPSSTNITPSGWTLGEPVITGGPCATSSTTLTWNSIQKSGQPVGRITEDSEDIYIKYKVQVSTGVQSGTTLINGAGIKNDLPEDPVYSNGDTKSVTVPFADIYAIKTSPTTALGGTSFEYIINYGNASRQNASNVYVVDTLPDTDADGASDVTLISVAATGTKYYNSAVGVAPIFTPLTPNTNGWTTTLTANANHIAILYGDMAGNDGPYTVKVKVTARNPNTNIKTSAGTKLVNNVTSYTSSAEATTTNNSSAATTTVPSFDLSILKKGSVEGAYPGTTPGAPMSYIITVQNPSTVPACGVYFTDTVPTGFVYGNISPTTINLTDGSGNAKKFETAAGVPINTNTNLVQTVTGQSHRYQFGTTHTDICMPAGTQAQFTITGTIDANVTDGTQLSNVAIVGEDSIGVENILNNNTATSTVSVWRADVTTSKDGYSCGPDNICGNADDSQTNASVGETLRYNIEYDNIGNFNASNTILEELVPAGTCFKVGSISPIPGSTVEYSSDSASSWGYTPVGTAGSCDQNVTNFRVKWNVLRAPANAVNIDTLTEINSPNAMDLNTTISTTTILGTTGNFPNAITIDAAGNVYTANQFSNNITKITPAGVSSILGTTVGNPRGITIDAAGNIYTANSSSVTKITPSGATSTLGTTSSGPTAITIDAAGNVYTANVNSNNVTKITPAGATSTLGTTGSNPRAITIDAAGNVYTANGGSNNVTKITPAGATSTLGTTGSYPSAITIDAAGNVYTANSDSNSVTKITPAGVSTTLGTTGSGPTAITIDAAGNVYTANVNSNNVTKITPAGVSSILVATGSGPNAIAIDSTGNIYIANSSSRNVTKITQNQNPDIRLACNPAYTVDTPEPGYTVPQSCRTSGYATYAALSTTVNFSWDKFLVNQNTPASTSVSYTLCKTNFTGVEGVCLASDVIYMGSAASGYIDISAVPTTQNIYVRVDLSGSGADTPIVDSLAFSYRGPTPSFTWDAKVVTTQSPLSSINNVVSIQTDTPESNIDNNSDTDVIQLNQADLEIVKTVNTAAAQTGDTLTYTLDYKNNGPTEAKGVVITDTLPTDSTFVSAVSNTPGVTCGVSSGVITCTKPAWNIPVNESGKITVKVIIKALCYAYTAPTTISPATYDSPEPYNTNIAINVPDNFVINSAKLSYVVNNQDGYGSYYSAAALASPNSTSTLFGLNNDPYLSNVENYSMSTNEPGFIGQNAQGVWNLRFTSQYSQSTISGISLALCSSNPLVGGTTLTNNTSITSSTTDPNTANNGDAAYTVVGDYANNYITKSGPARANVDKDVVYSVSFGNNGSASATNTQIIDTYNTNEMSFVSAVISTNQAGLTLSCGVSVAGTVVCDQNGAAAGGEFTLNPAATGTVTVTMHINNDFNLLINNEIINNDIIINSSSTESTIIDNADDHDVPVWPLGYSSVSGFEYIDKNQDNKKTTNEKGIAGIVITIAGTDIYGHVISATTTTDINGFYSFVGLAPGTYSVTAAQPVTYASVNSAPGYIAPATSTQVGSSAGQNKISAITVGESQNSINNNFGEISGEIGNMVWNDANDNGVRDIGELGIGGVQVYAYFDANNNGVVDAGEAGYVVYTRTSEQIIGTTTYATGTYEFTNLPLGKYLVLVNPQSPVLVNGNYVASRYGATGVNDNNQNNTGYVVSLTAGAPNNYTADFGYKLPVASIGNTVWFDVNNNGYQDVGEMGLSGVTVNLYNATGTLILSTTTDATGNYLFENLSTYSTYTVKVATSTLPAYITGSTHGTISATTTDGYAKDPFAYTIALGTTTNLTADFGFTTLGSIGNYIWFDRDADGYNDATSAEPPLANVTVNLYSATGTLLASTNTNALGVYLFTGLSVFATYTVSVATNTMPAWANTITTGTSTANDYSHGTSTSAYLSTTTPNVMFLDFGFTSLGTIGNQLFQDNNLDGTYSSSTDTNLVGWLVSLFTDNNNDGVLSTSTGDTLYATTTTDSTGNYSFTNLPLVSYIVKVTNSLGNVFTQIFGSNTNANNNAQVNNYAVTLSTSTASTTNNNTADFGYYMMPDLTIRKIRTTPSPIYVGGTSTYQIVTSLNVLYGAATNTITVTDTLPAGLTFVSATGTNWSCNNTVVCTYTGTYPVLTGTILPTITVVTTANATGTIINTAKTSMVSTTNMYEATTTNNLATASVEVLGYGSISGNTFSDLNNNGTYATNTDTTIASMLIELLNSFGVVISTATTSATGSYMFSNLAPNSYTVRVATNTAPVGYVLQSSNTITISTSTTQINLNAQNLNFGFVPTADLGVTKTVNSATYTQAGQLVYTIKITNNGPVDVISAGLLDNMPAEISSSSWSCSLVISTDGACSTATGIGSIMTTYNLNVGKTITYIATGTVSTTSTSTITNTAIVNLPLGYDQSASRNDTDVATASSNLFVPVVVPPTPTSTPPVTTTPTTTTIVNVIWSMPPSTSGPITVPTTIIATKIKDIVPEKVKEVVKVTTKEIKVIVKKVNKLSKTGSDSTKVLMLSGVVLSTLGLYSIFFVLKKRKQEEERV